MGEAELQTQFHELRREVGERMSKFESELANINTEVRVTKHDVNNMQQMVVGLDRRLEKMQESLTLDIKAIGIQISAVNMKQEKGAGFYAGVIAAATMAISVISLLVKFLTDQHP